MTTTVTCVRPDSSLLQAAKHMKQENIGTIPVCTDRGEPIGILTDRDIVVRSLANEPDTLSGSGSPAQDEASGQNVMDVMTRNLVCAAPDMDIHDASLLFAKHQVRRLPVTENGKLVGMLTLSDVARKPLYVDEAGDALNAISRPSTIS